MVIKFAQCKVVVLGIDYLELATIYRDIRLGEKFQSHTELVKFFICLSDNTLSSTMVAKRSGFVEIQLEIVKRSIPFDMNPFRANEEINVSLK